MFLVEEMVNFGLVIYINLIYLVNYGNKSKHLDKNHKEDYNIVLLFWVKEYMFLEENQIDLINLMIYIN